MNSIQYLNFIIENAFLIFAMLFFVFGLLIGMKAKNIRKNLQRHTYIIFIDTGEVFDHWGWNEVFSLEDADYIVDHHKRKGNSLFFDSRFSEPPQFKAYEFDKNGIPPISFTQDMTRWRYWIDSKMFFRVLENKVLEKMMQIQASDMIRFILVGCLISIFLGLITIYLVYKGSTEITTIGQMLSDVVKNLRIG